MSRSIVHLSAAILAAGMAGMRTVSPELFSQHPPVPDRARASDTRVKRRPLSRYRDNPREIKRAEFAKKVRATHSDRPDPRDDKYLHSYARQMRRKYPGQAARDLFA